MRNLIESFKKKILRFVDEKLDIFLYDSDKMEEYLDTFPEPNDDIERSFFQYKCQMKHLGNLWFCAFSAISIPILIKYSFKKKIKGLFIDEKKNMH